LSLPAVEEGVQWIFLEALGVEQLVVLGEVEYLEEVEEAHQVLVGLEVLVALLELLAHWEMAEPVELVPNIPAAAAEGVIMAVVVEVELLLTRVLAVEEEVLAILTELA
jgi:hypothetical protein